MTNSNPYAGWANALTQTPQSEPIPTREAEMVQNNAVGFVFAIDKWARLERFLVLGSDGGTYYTTAKKLTEENAKCVLECIAENGQRTVSLIHSVSDEGRAIRNDPALFALALCMAKGDMPTKRAAVDVLPRVARIGTHLFHFVEYVSHMRGFGRLLKNAIAAWYDTKNPDQVAFQAVKYGQRDGWSHKDLIALSHPGSSLQHPSGVRNAPVYDWVMQDGRSEARPGRRIETEPTDETLPRIIEGYLKVQELRDTDLPETARLIRDYKLPREALPTEVLKSVNVWSALLDTDMGPEAMIRNLGVMSANGLLVPMSDASRQVIETLHDADKLKRARLHPIKALVGSRIYGQGHGEKGSLKWSVVPAVMDALNDAFYLAFGAVEPTNKRTMLALDVSGSMSVSLSGLPLSAREGSAAMALVTANVEPNHMFAAFGSKFDLLDISPKRRLDDVEKTMRGLGMQRTDCALPMVWALEHKFQVDTFVIYTDNETWAGTPHPTQALAQYRQKMGIPAKLAVVGMTSTAFSIADPNDSGQMDFVGFDTSTPDAITAFVR